LNDYEREKLRQEIFGNNKVEQEQGSNPSVNPGLLKLFPSARLERIKRRELRRFKQRQDVKWSHWLEAVSK